MEVEIYFDHDRVEINFDLHFKLPYIMLKLHFGHGIAIVYSLFVLGMVTAVIRSTHHNPGLVDKNYYQLDINYQKHLEKRQHATALAQKPTVVFDNEKQKFAIQFPAGQTPSGKVKFVRPSTPGTDDFVVAISTDAAGKMSVPAEKMTGGRWRVELEWQADGTSYFWETVATTSR